MLSQGGEKITNCLKKIVSTPALAMARLQTLKIYWLKNGQK
jgi:hypothetical protein